MRKSSFWVVCGALVGALSACESASEAEGGTGPGAGAGDGVGGSGANANGGNNAQGGNDTGGNGSGAGSAGDEYELIGAECFDEADCDEGGLCFSEDGDDFLDGGVAAGYCTADCTDYLNAVIEADGEDPGVEDPCGSTSICLNFGSDTVAKGRCVLGCSYGFPNLDTSEDPNGELEAADKCRLRSDVACYAFDTSDDPATTDVDESGFAILGEDGFPLGWCRPACVVDDQCPVGRVCDAQLGACVDTADKPTGLGKGGELCSILETYGDLENPDDGTRTCEGLCIRLFDAEEEPEYADVGMCFDQCISGVNGTCENGGSCIYDFYSPEKEGSTEENYQGWSNSWLDIGQCAPGATVDADCAAEYGNVKTLIPGGTGSATLCLFMGDCEDDTDCGWGCWAQDNLKGSGASSCDDISDDSEDNEVVVDETGKPLSALSTANAPKYFTCQDTGGNKKYCLDHEFVAGGEGGGGAGGGSP